MKIFYLKDYKARQLYKKWEATNFLLNYHLSFLRKDNNIKMKKYYKEQIKLPSKSSIVKIKNRCRITFRGRSNYKKLKLSRIMIKKLVFEGDFTGYKPLNW